MEIEDLSNYSKGLYNSSFEKDACGLGFVTAGRRGACHQIIKDALTILKNLSHRGAQGADGKTGDGAGILLQIPKLFFQKQNLPLPADGSYGVGVLFLPQDSSERARMEEAFTELATEFHLPVLCWRTVPVNSSLLGTQAGALEPVIRQVFLSQTLLDDAAFEKRLWLLRMTAERKLRQGFGTRNSKSGEVLSSFYIASLSQHTLVYKALVLPQYFGDYFLDLQNSEMTSALAMVHSRFSTNTLPAWELAHPYRMIAHNGEINTIRGNLKWMQAREAELAQELVQDLTDPKSLLPLVPSGQSDSQSLDNVVDLLLQTGYSLPEVLMILIPEPWESNAKLSPELKAFYAFHAPRMEPWDGPAAVCFTDGRNIGARLDRNGLRPCRYILLDDESVIVASEAGVLDVNPERIVRRGRIQPGQIFMVDTHSHQIFQDDQLKTMVAQKKPYLQWVEEEQLSLRSQSEKPEELSSKGELSAFTQFGYSSDEIRQVILPMMCAGEEAGSSMGNDTPLAILSDQPQILFNYFRQMFAQVTNPPIDPIREESVMSLTTFLGAHGNLSTKLSDKKTRLRLSQPFLSTSEFQSLLQEKNPQAPKTAKISLLTEVLAEGSTLKRAIDQICEQASRSIAAGAEILILSDRGLSSRQMAIPSLLAVSAVHHYLIRQNLRMKISILVETGEARDVHHFACLFAYGAQAIHPYLIKDLAQKLKMDQELPSYLNPSQAEKLFIKAAGKGLLKIMSKMGISTLQSYCGAQIFEILGLSQELVDDYFPGTPTRIGGLTQDLLARECKLRFDLVLETSEQEDFLSQLPVRGHLYYRAEGEAHLWNPATIANLQKAARNNDPASFREFSEEVQRSSRFTLRGLLSWKSEAAAIPLQEVESASSIVRRFTTGAMSLGALGKEAHESLAIAMNRIGAKSNSGEGGESADRFGNSKNSQIKQIASARFGVTAHYLVNATELQIKMAQGAKPGEGGQLPGHKVDSMIASLRHSTPGVTLISPPPHHDIYSIEDLAQLIYDLKNCNPQAQVSVKLVSEAGIGTVAAGVAKAKAQKIIISGDSGGTGASPLSSIHYAGIPWEIGLAEVHQSLVLNGLRSWVRLETDGQLKTGRDVAIAALLGAQEFGFATAPLIVEGCIMMRKCHLNTCPVGIATQDPVLRAKFRGQPEHLIHYFYFVAEELRGIMSELGFRTLEEMVGRADLLHFQAPQDHWKAHSVDLSKLLAPVKPLSLSSAKASDFYPSAIDQEFIEKFWPPHGEPILFSAKIKNTQRSVGARTSGLLAQTFGVQGLLPNSIQWNLQGSAGQSFGAFLSSGLTLNLQGEANDYVGKGLSGGRIIISPLMSQKTSYSESIIAGNTCLYGATSGEAFFSGSVGERFAVRNSGALAVAEGTGDHACEYMTGGDVIILGKTGQNFGAGMSGGMAYVLDEEKTFALRCNLSGIELSLLSDEEDQQWLFSTLQRYVQATGSAKAEMLLLHWPKSLTSFVKVVPKEFKAVRNTEKIKVKEIHV